MIGGNVIAQIQTCKSSKNSIGETIRNWSRVIEINGYLDYMGGEASYSNHDSKIVESTHIFICDFVRLPAKLKTDNSRLVADGKIFDIKLIDNPMGINKHLEIYLKYVGGDNSGI